MLNAKCDNKQTDTDERPSLATLATAISTIGGTSGAIYRIMLASASNYIQQQAALFGQPGLTNCERVKCLLGLVRHCIERLSTYSGAQVNDRSMLGKTVCRDKLSSELAMHELTVTDAVV